MFSDFFALLKYEGMGLENIFGLILGVCGLATIIEVSVKFRNKFAFVVLGMYVIAVLCIFIYIRRLFYDSIS